MSVAKFQAVKMSDAKVSHISLVERGANRIPFKVIKEEKQNMGKFASLDLSGLGAVFTRKADKVETAVTGVLIMKGEHFESIKKQVEAAGYDVAQALENEDGSVVFKQGEGDVVGDTVIRLNDHIALVTKGFSPYNMDITSDGTTFADICSAQGFYPGITTIMEVLASSVRDTVYKAASPADAKSSVAKLFSEAQAYTSAFLAGLPVKAFKMETISPETTETPNGDGVTDAPAEAEMAPEGMDEQEAVAKGFKPFVKGGGKAKLTPEEQALADAEAAKAKAKKEDESAATDAAPEAGMEESPASTETTPAVSLTADQVSDIVSTHVAKAMDALAESLNEKLGGLNTAFAEVQKSVGTVTDTMGGLAGRMEAAERVAKAAQEAVTGTVIHGSESGDTVPAQKSETSKVSRDIDTGFGPKGAFPTRRQR